MRARHDHLYVTAESPVHRLAPHDKVAATIVFVFAVVATPRDAVWAFGIDAAVVLAVAVFGSVPLMHVLRRLTVEVPFLLFAFFLPFLGQPPDVDVLGMSLSEAGLWAAWGILVKASLGVTATVLLASTTSIPDILAGLERLRVPSVMVAITAFMIRYGDLLGDDLRRMRIARESRADNPRWIWQAKAVASTAGTLFVRSYERGERVHHAMQARGFAGSMPAAGMEVEFNPICFVPALVAVGAAATAWMLQ